MTIQELQGITKQFEYYRMIAEKTISRLSEEELNLKISTESNSVAMLMRHLTGNLLSRFTNFFTEDGEKPWRNRDDEFADGTYEKIPLIAEWNSAWDTLFQTLKSINTTNIEQPVKIRNQEHTVSGAIYRQLSHYPYHIGQIVFIGKLIRNQDWQSLTIAKNKSQEYNRDRFDNPNSETHFSQGYLDKNT
ncbi:DUF1572 family protein [Sphingobacterium tabacisoli]|uniref:DUF1572 family protein n=1 Tax=Sphingobacterium tabacisoli TaxID=2044855 RepID=A0ABW5L589_9SPHI|nr:DUF1572 family protein [Sphingobacterium tabacisoli]